MMQTFKFEAVDKDGQVVKDLIEAISIEDASEKIRNKDCYPTRIKPHKSVEKRKAKSKGGKRKRVSWI